MFKGTKLLLAMWEWWTWLKGHWSVVSQYQPISQLPITRRLCGGDIASWYHTTVLPRRCDTTQLCGDGLTTLCGADGPMARLLSWDGGRDTWIATDNIAPTLLLCFAFSGTGEGWLYQDRYLKQTNSIIYQDRYLPDGQRFCYSGNHLLPNCQLCFRRYTVAF